MSFIDTIRSAFRGTPARRDTKKSGRNASASRSNNDSTSSDGIFPAFLFPSSDDGGGRSGHADTASGTHSSGSHSHSDGGHSSCSSSSCGGGGGD